MATRKIHFFTGKGGVGKSLISSAFALAHAMKKNTPLLLTELSEESYLPRNFNSQKIAAKNEKFATFEDSDHPHLHIAHWTTESCLNEYALSLIRSQKLTDLFLNNAVSKALINTAPGLMELALLGKATSGPRNAGPKMNYSEIFIDSFSSGHFVNLITTPSSFADTFKMGPMAKQSQSINQYLQDPSFTDIHVVGLSNSLILTESYELYSKLSDLNLNVHFILNQYIDFDEIVFSDLKEESKKYFSRLLEEQQKAEAFLKKNKIAFSKVPLVSQTFNKEMVKQISNWMTKHAEIK